MRLPRVHMFRNPALLVLIHVTLPRITHLLLFDGKLGRRHVRDGGILFHRAGRLSPGLRSWHDPRAGADVAVHTTQRG